MTSKTKKYLLYSIPLIVGGYFILKQFLRKGNKVEDAPLPPPPLPSSPTVQSDYPLQVGSRNSSVGSLQSLLNTALQCQKKPLLSVDSIFGSKTEAALQSLTNKTSLKSAAEFESLKKSLANTCNLSANLDWAWKLIAASDSGKYSYLIVKNPVTLYEVVKDFTGKWIPKSPNKVINLPVKSNYSLNDYKLRSATTDGKLRLEIVKGDLAGMWITQAGTNLTNTFNIS